MTLSHELAGCSVALVGPEACPSLEQNGDSPVGYRAAAIKGLADPDADNDEAAYVGINTEQGVGGAANGAVPAGSDGDSLVEGSMGAPAGLQATSRFVRKGEQTSRVLLCFYMAQDG